MAVMMPLEITAARAAEARWDRVKLAFEESVRQIFERASPQDQPTLLIHATEQFRRHVEGLQGDLPRLSPVIGELAKIQKAESPRATVDRLRQALQTLTGRGIVVRATRAEGSAMTSYEKMCAQAQEKVTKGEVKDLSEGIAKVAAENPDLYAEYKAERRAGVRHVPASTPVTKAAPAKTPALQALEAAAQRIQKRLTDAGEWIDEREALVQAAQLHPDLYEQYRQERRALWRR